MADETTRRTGELVERLRQQGHHVEADRLTRALRKAESGVLFALREACETILTALEAIDPVTETMFEQLRVEVEKVLRTPEERKGA